MIRRLLAVVAASLLVSAVAVPAQAQTTRTSGAVRGVVEGPDGAAVPGANVLLRDVERGVTREKRADGEGRFTFGLLPPGTYLYAVRSRSRELEAGEAGPIRVRPGQRNAVRVRLQPGTYVYSETEEELGLSVSEAGVVELVDQAQLEGQPTRGRDWKQLFLLSGLVSLAEGGGFTLSGTHGGLPVLVDGQQP